MKDVAALSSADLQAILNGAIVNVNDAQVSVVYTCVRCGGSVVKYVPSWWNTAHEVQFIHVGPPCPMLNAEAREGA